MAGLYPSYLMMIFSDGERLLVNMTDTVKKVEVVMYLARRFQLARLEDPFKITYIRIPKNQQVSNLPQSKPIQKSTPDFSKKGPEVLNADTKVNDSNNNISIGEGIMIKKKGYVNLKVKKLLTLKLSKTEVFEERYAVLTHIGVLFFKQYSVRKPLNVNSLIFLG